MAMVNSALGPLDTARLGFTLMHEHLILASAGVLRDYPELLGTDLLERAVNALKEARMGGVDTIVDASTIDLGRDIVFTAEASRQSGVNIIACAGWYLDTPRLVDGVDPNLLAAGFVREIEQGISGTKIKAGILKAASDMEGVTLFQETVLRAVARAHLKTGAPIMLHSYAAGQVGRRQMEILKAEGVDPKRVKIDHCNDTTDVEYLQWLLDQGCYLGLDRYAGRGVSPMARTKTMKVLMDGGYAGRLCPSHDRGMLLCEKALEKRWGMPIKEWQAANPYGYLYMKKVVFPQLRDMGVSQAALDRLCVDGPRNFFEGV